MAFECEVKAKSISLLNLTDPECGANPNNIQAQAIVSAVDTGRKIREFPVNGRGEGIVFSTEVKVKANQLRLLMEAEIDAHFSPVS